MNKETHAHGLSVEVESTDGSVYNINAVLAGEIAFGIAQSDKQFQAVNGMSEWEGKGPQDKLRAVFSLHPETVTLVAAADAGIKTLKDLAGKRVNIGSHDSGQHQNSTDALDTAGMSLDSINAEHYTAAEALDLLQKGDIDAFFYTVGHPSEAIRQACKGVGKVRIVSINGMDTLLAKYPYYVPSMIPMDYYPEAVNSGEEVFSFGVKATLVTSSDVPDDVVYALTRELFENFDEFKKLHPAFCCLTKKGMLRGLSAPIHAGALRYYKEAGLK